MKTYEKILLNNKAWALEMKEHHPGFLENLSKAQAPEFLWIGCSDSRVPVEEITGAKPGEIFVHRNVANLVIQTDFNVLSVVQYAVETLRVKNIVVCGHYGCGGIRAALSNADYGLLNKWLYDIKLNYAQHANDLRSLTEEDRLDRMVELSVRDQVRTLSHMAIIQRAWRDRQGPVIHGWVFGLKDGLIRELTMASHETPVDPAFRFL